MSRSSSAFPDPIFWQGRPTFLICLLTYKIQFSAEARWIDPSTDPDDVRERRIRSDIREVLRLLRDIQGVNQRALATLATRLRSFRSAFFRAMRNDAGRALRAKRIEHIEPENHAAYQHEMISQTLLGTSIVSATQTLADSLPVALRRVWRMGEILGEMFFPSSSHRLAGDIPNPRRQLLEIDAIGRKLAVTWPGMRNLQTSDDPTESQDEIVSRLDRLLEEIPEALGLWWGWPVQPFMRPRTQCVLLRVRRELLGSEVASGNPRRVYYVPTDEDVRALQRLKVLDASGRPLWSRLEKELVRIAPDGVEPLRHLSAPALIAKIKQFAEGRKSVTRKKGGRPRISVEEAADRKQLVEDWHRAHDAGTEKKVFCERRKITLTELNRCLDWDAKRRTR